MHDRNPADHALEPRPEQSGKALKAAKGKALPAGQHVGLLADFITDYAICTLDGQGHVRSWNRGAETLLGYNATEILGKHVSCFCPDTDLLQEASQETSIWCVRKDETRFQARAVMSDAHIDSGDAPGFVLVLQNTSQSLTQKQALFESEQRFRILVEGVRDYAIYMLDPDGYITNWNSGAELIKGYTKEEIVGQHFSCFYTSEDQARGEAQHSLDSALKNNTFQHEAWRVRKDGSRFLASVVIDPIFDANHKLLGFAKVTRDITKQKHAQDKIAQQREALHQSQKLEAIGRLTGSITHDFNNLLAIIRTAAELLESSATLTPEKQSRYTRMILDTTNRAGRLIDQLLSFAHRQPLKNQVFCVKTRIQEFKPIIDTTVGSHLTLRVSFSDDLAFVETDPGQFETAILNMIINARDVTPDDGIITISGCNATLDKLDADGGVKKLPCVAVSVSDTGSGIDPSVLPNIFEPFFTTKEINKGTGLGLSQVYGFAKQSGGDIVVESEPGKGTCFTLYLPCPSGENTGWDGVLSPLGQSMLEHD